MLLYVIENEEEDEDEIDATQILAVPAPAHDHREISPADTQFFDGSDRSEGNGAGTLAEGEDPSWSPGSDS